MRWARGSTAVVAAVLVALGATLLFGFSATLNPIDALLGRGAVLTVPDFAGDPRPRAEAEATELGLEVRVTTSFSLTAPRGTVIGQTPRAGERVRSGTELELVVSRGERRVEMPDAVGEPVVEVIVELEDAGVPVDQERVASEDVAAGVVIEQEPEPGVVVTGEDTVRFTVSSGPAERPVPEVVGLSLDAAGFELGVAGLVPAEPQLRTDPVVPAGAVVAAEPPPGTVVERDSEVVLVVSAGGEPVAVPDVVNATEAAARASLEALGLRVVLGGRLVGPDGAGLGAVFEQFPAAGEERRPGDPVTIVVGLDPPDPPPPRPTPTTAPPTTAAPTTTTTTAPAAGPGEGDGG